MRSIPPMGSIPSSVRERKSMGMQRGKPRPSTFDISGKPINPRKPSKKSLGGLLAWGQKEEQKCIDLLKVLTPEFPEYEEVLTKMGKLQSTLEQIKRQLSMRR